jgi:hypothetical protein
MLGSFVLTIRDRSASPLRVWYAGPGSTPASKFGVIRTKSFWNFSANALPSAWVKFGM